VLGFLNACSSGSSGISTSNSFSSAGIIGSPFTTSTSSAAVNKSSRVLSSTYTDLKTKLDNMLAVSGKAAADCQALFTIDFSKFSSANASCYGPSITLGGTHPDTSGSVTGENRPGGDLGIWDTSDASGTACAAAQVTSLTDYAGTMSFYSQFLAAYLYCYVNNSGGSLSIPSTSGSATSLSSSDLTSFGFTSGKDELTATAASITAFTAAGDLAYRYEIQGTMKDGDLSPAKTVAYKIVVQYSKTSAGAQTGTASYAFGDSSPSVAGNCPAGGVTYAGKETFNYSGSTDTVVLKHAEFCGSSATPLNTTTYDIDFSSKYDAATTPNGWGNNANYVLFSFDPTTFDGSYVYAWQAGKGDGATRLFNAKIATTSGTQSGTAYVGFGDDIATTATLGTIKGMICNWTGTGSAKTLKNYVQSQDIAKSSGKWVATASHIKFAPMVDCFSASPPCSMTYNSTSSTMANDSAVVGAGNYCSGDLTALGSVSFTPPTAPTFN
jgi:hypothetical protein